MIWDWSRGVGVGAGANGGTKYVEAQGESGVRLRLVCWDIFGGWRLGKVYVHAWYTVGICGKVR